eukprot:3117318-Ditylum_brightwellii.AAC.1
MARWIDPLSDCISIQVGHATYLVFTKRRRLTMKDITLHARYLERTYSCMSKMVVDMSVTTSKCCINLQNMDSFMVSVNSSGLDFN